MTKYKLPLHIKNYVRQELYDFKKNKKIIEDLQKQSQKEIITRTLLIATQKIIQIENVLNKFCRMFTGSNFSGTFHSTRAS